MAPHFATLNKSPCPHTVNRNQIAPRCSINLQPRHQRLIGIRFLVLQDTIDGWAHLSHPINGPHILSSDLKAQMSRNCHESSIIQLAQRVGSKGFIKFALILAVFFAVVFIAADTVPDFLTINGFF